MSRATQDKTYVARFGRGAHNRYLGLPAAVPFARIRQQGSQDSRRQIEKLVHDKASSPRSAQQHADYIDVVVLVRGWIVAN
jgi:hypothetical protein